MYVPLALIKYMEHFNKISLGSLLMCLFFSLWVLFQEMQVSDKKV